MDGVAMSVKAASDIGEYGVVVGDWERMRHYATPIFEATVRSLSNFALFRSKACCRQSSNLLQLWCSGRRCAPQNSALQCGHWPTIRTTAELHGVSASSWQRFLAGIMRYVGGEVAMWFLKDTSRGIPVSCFPLPIMSD